MADLTQLGLDQYMIASNSPLNTDNSQTVVGIDQSMDNAVGAVTLAAGRMNSRIDLGAAKGSAYVRLDGPNNNITINDGTVTRILIGFQSGGF